MKTNLNTETIIEKISEEYRKKMKKISGIEKEILDITKEMEDQYISYKKFLDLQKYKEELEAELIQVRYVADGIAQAREIVFELM